ncbi:COMM domain-containing protein 5 isoform X1 [Hemicordylus capensis]|uniref:COMM domain-containing protein 5 isoform X1 n=1 Tax=Hemicordylus capensis TaxID=884348 RepID=UPI002303FE5B|nr:COMM domain-containing protein 5 isoform X1 [Hemicordylus capensis]
MAAAAGKALSPPYPHQGPVGESGLGRVSFLGARLPPEVEAMARSLRELDKETFRKLLKVAVSALEGRDCREAVRAIAESASLPDAQLAVLVSGMYLLLREALRLPTASLKQEVFKEDLKELRSQSKNLGARQWTLDKITRLSDGRCRRIPEDFIVDFATVAFGNRRPVLEATIQQRANKLPRIEDFKWRVDVAISTSSLARALQPSILMQMKLSDGTAHRLEVPAAKFQELRYNVALILKEMNDLEKRSVLKIQD